MVTIFNLLLWGFNELHVGEVGFVEAECAVTFIKTLKDSIIPLLQLSFNLVRNLGDIELLSW